MASTLAVLATASRYQAVFLLAAGLGVALAAVGVLLPHKPAHIHTRS